MWLCKLACAVMCHHRRCGRLVFLPRKKKLLSWASVVNSSLWQRKLHRLCGSGRTHATHSPTKETVRDVRVRQGHHLRGHRTAQVRQSRRPRRGGNMLRVVKGNDPVAEVLRGHLSAHSCCLASGSTTWNSATKTGRFCCCVEEDACHKQGANAE